MKADASTAVFRWSEHYKLSIYSRKKDSIDGKISLSDAKESNLSPYTNLVLNSSIEFLKRRRNLIVVSPKLPFKPVSLLGYLVADFFNCDVEIVTNRYNLKDHVNTYCLLADDRKQGWYTFIFVPPLVMEEEHFKPYLYIPRAKKDQKQKLREIIARNLCNTNRVIFVEDKITLPVNPSKILVENKEKEILKVNLKPQVFLIENGTYYLRHHKYFIEWYTSEAAENTNFIMFVGNLLSEQLSDLAKKTNSEVLYFSPSFFHATRDAVYKKYKEKLEKKRVYKTNDGWKILNKLNFDDEWDYHKPEIEIIRIEGYRELDEYLKEIRREAHIIGSSHAPRYVKWLASYIEGATVMLIGGFLPPDTRKVFDVENKRTLPLLEFVIEKVFQYLEKIEDPKLGLRLRRLYENFVRIYRSLNEIRRPHKGENLKDSKYITLLELLEKKEPETKYYVLKLYDSKKRLKEVITYFLKEKGLSGVDVEVCSLNHVVKNYFNIDSNSVLIFPTPLTSGLVNYFFLLRPFRKILILLYEGIERENYFDDLKKSEVFELKQSIDSIHKIHKVMRVEPPKIFVNIFNKLVEEYGLSAYLKEIVEIKERAPAPRGGILGSPLPELDQAEREMKRYRLVLRAKNGRETKEIVCVYYKPILKLDLPSMALEETTVAALKEGDIVCLIDDDEKKHIVDLISEIFMSDGEVDVDLVKYWYIKLKKYILDQEVSISDFYYMYKAIKDDDIKDYQTIRQWIRGGVLGPRDLNDLKVLAEIIEDDFLKENCEKIFEEIEKVRKVHRLVGRKINKIVRGLLTSDFSGVTSFDEKLLLSKLKLYEVLKINELA